MTLVDVTEAAEAERVVRRNEALAAVRPRGTTAQLAMKSEIRWGASAWSCFHAARQRQCR